MRECRLRGLIWTLAIALLASASPAMAGQERPADGLLKLVPASAGVVVTIEDLQGQSRAFLASPLAGRLKRLPTVQNWLAANGLGQIESARLDIERALGVTLEQIRDDLLGDAVVLALHVEPGTAPEQHRGLLLTRVRDLSKLQRLIDRLNELEQSDGPLQSVSSKTYRSTDYTVRRFQPGTKELEAYVILADSVFAWSNSERLIQEVIDFHQNHAANALSDEPRFQAVRDALPSNAVASAFVDPRYLEYALAADAGGEPDPGDVLVSRALAAVQYVGLALELRDGVILHLHQQLDPALLDEPLRRLVRAAGSDAEIGPLLDRIPATAPVCARVDLDLRALAELVIALVPDEERPRIEPFLDVMQGVLMDRDVLSEVLPSLGPSVVAFVDAPEVNGGTGGMNVPVVFAVAMSGDLDDPNGLPAAIDRALRTVLSLATFSGPPGRWRVETIERDRVRVTALVGRKVPVAYTLGPGFVAIGTSPDSVAAFASNLPGDWEPGASSFAHVRAEYFPEARAFVYADLDAVVTRARQSSTALVQKIAAAQGTDASGVRDDLEKALALLGIFRAGFLSQEVAADLSAIRQTVGLLTAEPAGAP